MTIFQFKQKAAKQFSSSSIKSVTLSPSLDIEILLSHFLGLNKTQILMNSRKELEQSQINILNEAVEKRLTGFPIAYITNEKEFYGYNFYVTPDVLIPKPDTEVLVEEAVKDILDKINAYHNKILTICDMCTGSGCIALAVFRTLRDQYNMGLSQMPDFTLVDISAPALDIAKKNIETLLSQEERSHIKLVQSNLFERIPETFDVILTNPPYIPHTLVNELLEDGRSEPRLALDGDVTLSGDAAAKDDGLEIIRNLIPQAHKHLAPSGIILMETGEYNAEDAAALGKAYNFTTDILKDLEGQLRVVKFY